MTPRDAQRQRETHNDRLQWYLNSFITLFLGHRSTCLARITSHRTVGALLAAPSGGLHWFLPRQHPIFGVRPLTRIPDKLNVSICV